jgi:hypothetical protein
MALLFAAYLLTNGAFVVIAATLARGGLINSDKSDIYACQPGLPARDVLSVSRRIRPLLDSYAPLARSLALSGVEC